jgi:hypothetical protein
LSIDADEIAEYLESKPLKRITLPQNSNDLDQGSDSPKAESKIGQKSSLARAQYLVERDKKIQFGDKQAISEYVTEQNEIRQRLEEQKYRQRLEFDLEQEEKKRLAIESKITDEDRKNEAEDIQKLENRKQKEIDNVYDYFNCTEEFWNKWQTDGHKPEESPANALIQTGTVGFVCDIHRYKACIPFPDGRLATSAFTIGPIEDHIRRHDPDMHKAAIISSINEKYDKLIEDRKQLTLQDPDIKFKREVRDIDSVKTRPGGDVIYSARKITKGDKARLRESEEAENEKNRKIYRGLY